MLEKLKLRNFQAHSKLVIEFDQRITTLVGATDAGKSAILRAIDWLSQNRFMGPADEFIRWGTSLASASLIVDGHEIIRRKGTENSYRFDGKEYKAFGTKVPDLIAATLNVNPANFQNQLDEHFWFSQSPGEVSRHLNQIINLGSIDETLSALAAIARKAQAEVTVGERRLQDTIAQKKGLGWILSVDERCKALERSESRITTHAARCRTLRELCDNFATLAETAENRSLEGDRAETLCKLARQAKAKAKAISKLQETLRAFQRATRLAKRKIPVVPDDASILRQRKQCETLRALLSQIHTTKEKLCQSQATSQAAILAIQKMTKGRCPVCNAVIKM